MSKRFPFLVLLLALSYLAVPTIGEAQYVGLEPGRLTSMVRRAGDQKDLTARLTEIEAQLGTEPRADLWTQKGQVLAGLEKWEEAAEAFRHASQALPEARLGLAVSLMQLGKKEEAFEAIGEPTEYRLRYARVLLKLRAEREVQFIELRSELRSILTAEPFFPGAFDLWLALNPNEDELEGYSQLLESHQDPRARLQRVETLLALDEPKRALSLSREIQSLQGELLNRLEWNRARANFQLDSHAAGQSVYWQILDRLDEPTADLLFRDLAGLASSSERAAFESLGLQDKPDFFRRFWIRRNPLPDEEVNPRLAEHYRRLARAQAEYPLQSTGKGYFTDEERFLSFSPRLRYFDSTAVFANGPASRLWLDHRGLILIRHGEPDLKIGPRRYGQTEPSESWLISRFQTRPMFFHFVQRRSAVGEWTLALNLAVAATSPAAADDPVQVANSLRSGFRTLYQSRFRLHPLFQQILQVRSRRDLDRILQAESQLGASFVSVALGSDSTDYYTRDNTLPLAVSASNYYVEGQPAVEVSFATDLQVIDTNELNEDSTLEATLLIYDRKWVNVRNRVQKKFPLWPPPPASSDDSKVFVGTIRLVDLNPEDYRLVLQVYQRESNRIGIARGRHSVAYVRHDNLGLSDLFLSQQPRNDQTAAGHWLPVPTRVVRHKQPVRIEFELYNLRSDDSGTTRYEVEERLLTLYKNPGVLRQIAGYANLAGQAFFPLYTFASQVGASVISQAFASETAGLEIEKRLVDRPASPVIREELHMDLEDLNKGVYTVYITIRDLKTGDVSSRFLTLQVT
jgi:GWxTD domain-containing protein